MTFYKLVKNSQPGGKLGGMTAVWVSSNTCPPSCAFNIEESCYGMFWNAAKTWDKVSAGDGLSFDELVRRFRDAGLSRYIRWAPAGDLPGEGECIDGARLRRLVVALSRWFVGFIMYTHKAIEGVHLRGHWRTRRANRAHLEAALSSSSSAINLSCDNAGEAERAMELGFDCTMPMPSDYQGNGEPVGRFKGRLCWAQSGEDRSCSNCGAGQPWCSIKGRGFVVQFKSHGARRSTVDRRLAMPILN